MAALLSQHLHKFEYHKNYIDVQYILSGEEIIGWAHAEQMTITENYDAKKDICFGAVEKERMTPVYMKAGRVAVFFPEDAHAPKLAANVLCNVCKVVVKVAVSV